MESPAPDARLYAWGSNILPGRNTVMTNDAENQTIESQRLRAEWLLSMFTGSALLLLLTLEVLFPVMSTCEN